MQSKITIEVDFENGNEPIIQIIYRSSDDVRDKLIKSFLERLQHTSSWAKIFCDHTSLYDDTNNKFQRWRISAMPISDLEKEAKIMMEQYRLGNS